MAPRVPFFHLTLLLVFLLVVFLPGPANGGRVLDGLAPVENRPEVAGAPAVADDASALLAQADALRRIGEREAALTALQGLLDHPDPAVAAQASYRTALLRLELGFPAEAAGVLENLLTRFPEASTADRSTFLLAVARRKAGDCPGAISALFQYTARTSLLAPHTSLQLAMCYQQLGDTGAALARTEDALQQPAPRLLRIEALERQADILEKAGDRAGALARYVQLIDLARDQSYKADVRLAVARLSHELGRDGDAATQLAVVVNDLPAARNAATALDRLNALGAQDRVSYFQAGLVRYLARDYAAAVRNFDGSLATPGEAADQPAAAYYRAVARVRQGAEVAGAEELLALPGSFPASRYAPDALLRAGKVLESNGLFTRASGAYQRVASDYPVSAEAPEGLFRLGLVSLLRGVPDEAGTAWARLGGSDAQPELRSLGLLWLGKVESQAGASAPAQTHWQQAADVGPTWYGGLRARALLGGSAGPLAEGGALDAARLELSPDDLAGLDSWMSARGGQLAALQAEQAAEPALARADELLGLGLDAEAGWEIDDLSVRWSSDPARLAGLALALHQRGLDAAALKQAQRAMDAAQVNARQAPVGLQKLLYPLAYPDLLREQAGRQGLDPLLLAALVWQESKFDPDARSAANALGLTQIIPSTANEISNALGRGNIRLNELLRPSISLEYGAFYFGQRVKRFGGAIFPALAAYNAGDGSVDRWLRDYGATDMDLFAERIPYAETNRYVKLICETYGMYGALYGAR